MVIGMGKKVKIDLIEPTFQASGVIYYAGYVNGVYTHILSYDRMSKADTKRKLLDKYVQNGHIL